MRDTVEAGAGSPTLGATFEGQSPICTACGHEAIVAPRRPSLVRRVLGMKPRPAECPVPEYDSSGLAALPCGCRDPKHGS